MEHTGYGRKQQKNSSGEYAVKRHNKVVNQLKGIKKDASAKPPPSLKGKPQDLPGDMLRKLENTRVSIQVRQM